jgi:hypothetical protein
MNTPTCPELPVWSRPSAVTADTSPADSAPSAPDSEPIVPFNVVVAYEDAPAGKHAMNVLRRLGARLRPQMELQAVLWRFDLLKNPLGRDHATADADAAGLIVFAMRNEAGELPEAVNTWSAECQARRRGQRLVMLTLFGPGDTWAVWIQDETQIRTRCQTSAAPAPQLPGFFERALCAA